MIYFRYSCVFIYLGLLSLLRLDLTEAKKRKIRHRRYTQLEWTGWTEWSACTAQCGTGAAFRERQCFDRRQRAYSNKCHGRKHEFKICNTRTCSHGQEPLREQLCTKHNTDVIGGKRYRWLPYLLHSARCELTCKASGHGFYNSFPDPIINGTTCTKDGSSVCVEGVCKKFGCDNIVGSKAKNDVCGVCDGDNSKCKMVKDIFEDESPTLKYGYNLVTIIPSGATSINVTQLRQGRNYIVLKYKNGKYIINGHRRLTPAGKHQAAGTTFTYHSRASKHCPGECLLADGPTTQDLEIMLLYFGRNTGILYQFGYPIDQNGMLKYQDLALGDSHLRLENNIDNKVNSRETPNNRQQYERTNYYHVSSGGGISNTNQNRDRYSGRNEQRNRDRVAINRNLPTERYDATVVIEESESRPNKYPQSKQEKSYYLSSLSGKSKLPGYTQSFTFMDKMNDMMHKNGILNNGQNDRMYTNGGNRPLADRNGRVPIIVSNPIDPETVAAIYSWTVSGYTKCNRTCGSGVQYPVVKCTSSGKEVPDKNCQKLNRPNESPVECNTHSCPASWEASPWSSCTASCDEGIQIRNISCLKEVSELLFLETTLDECSNLPAPATSQPCKIKDCFAWTYGAWGECSSNCGEGVRVRTVNCTSIDGQNVPDWYCNRTDIPSDEESCYSRLCETTNSAQWYFSTWQKECPVACGTGNQRRRVMCVSDNPYGPDCDDGDKPLDVRSCSAPKSCNGYWFSGPWQECNSTCGEGMRIREVMCLRPNGKSAYEIIPDDYCVSEDKPAEYEPCQSSPCPAEWFMSEWSECSVTCDKGQRSREVLCIDTNNHEVMSCDLSQKPSTFEECGTNPCNSYTAALESCKDTYPNCLLVVQAGMCAHEGYRKVCCVTCSSRG